MGLYWETTVIAMIAFVILYVLLSKYAFGPLFGIMEKRRQLVKDQMAEAENNRTQAAQLLEEQKQAIEAARKEAYQMIEQARSTSTKQADEIIAKAKSEAERLKEDALRDIENEKNKAVAALRSEVSEMSVMIASKIIEKEVDEKAQQQLIDSYLNKAGGQH